MLHLIPLEAASQSGTRKQELEDLEVVSFHLGLMQALLSDGSMLPVIELYDSEGEPTEEPEEAHALLAGCDEIGWFAVGFEEFEFTPAH